MRKSLLALAAAGSAFVFASPASAQYYPQPSPYGYGYGYNDGGRQVRWLERRIENVLRSLDGVRPDQRYQIRSEAIFLDRQLRYAARNGLNPYETRSFDVRIGRLEQRQHWASIGGGYRYDGYNGSNGYYGDRGGYDRGQHWGRDEDDNRDGD